MTLALGSGLWVPHPAPQLPPWPSTGPSPAAWCLHHPSGAGPEVHAPAAASLGSGLCSAAHRKAGAMIPACSWKALDSGCGSRAERAERDARRGPTGNTAAWLARWQPMTGCMPDTNQWATRPSCEPQAWMPQGICRPPAPTLHQPCWAKLATTGDGNGAVRPSTSTSP